MVLRLLASCLKWKNEHRQYNISQHLSDVTTAKEELLQKCRTKLLLISWWLNLSVNREPHILTPKETTYGVLYA